MTKVVVISSLLLWICTSGVIGAVNNSATNGATLIIYQFPEELGVGSNKTEETAGRTFNAWSILWYVGSFVGLIAFFFIISFSEWCCKRRLWRRRNTRNAISTSPSQNGGNDPAPPAYDLFAPPTYDSIYKDGRDEKPQFDVYVVPINSGEELGTQFCGSLLNESRTNRDEPTGPPSYTSTVNLSSANGTDSEDTNSTQTGEDPLPKPNYERRTKYRAPQPSSSTLVVPMEDSKDDGGGKISM